MQPTLVVLAAGMGSRYGSLKQIDAFGPSGETIIDYSVYDAIKAGFGKVVFVIRESLLEDFQKLYFDKFSDQIAIDYVFQELHNVPEGIAVPEDRVKPWGTGHAVLVAADKVKEPFAVINADDFYGADSFRLIADHLKGLDHQKVAGCMVGFQLPKTISEHGYVSRGVCEVDDSNHLLSITERTHITREADGNIYFKDEDNQVHLPESTIVSMNLMGFTPAVFNLMKEAFNAFIQERSHELKSEFYIPTILDQVANMTDVPVLESAEKWLGVTYKEDKPVVKDRLIELVEKGNYPSQLF
ncbi:MAG: sugar phosphate nucleotidyltransferase [Cytophagales bacterium]|nr:sugar phosphate nucleotidyltransferase [Cytophagales bacterium]